MSPGLGSRAHTLSLSQGLCNWGSIPPLDAMGKFDWDAGSERVRGVQERCDLIVKGKEKLSLGRASVFPRGFEPGTFRA